MKVVIVANRSEEGGAPMCMMEFVTRLKKKYSMEPIVLVSKDGKLAEKCRESGIEVHAVGHCPFSIGRGSTAIRRFGKLILRPYYMWSYRKANKRAVEQAGVCIDFSTVDLIHTNSNRDNLGALLSKKYNIPHVWHLREFGKEDYDCVFLQRGAIEFMNRHTTKFIAISKAVQNAWIKKGLKKELFVQIYDGVEVDKIQYCPKESFSDTMKFVFLGTICPSKGQFEAIKAMGKLPERLRGKIKLDFYGIGPNDYVAKMKKYIEKNNLTDAINFCGKTDDVYSLLKNYDAAMVCSRSEAFGRITPEYMAAGLCIIESDTGDNPELVKDKVNGLLYHYGDEGDLAKKIELLYDMKASERIAMSLFARDSAKEFSSEKNADKIAELYDKLMT